MRAFHLPHPLHLRQADLDLMASLCAILTVSLVALGAALALGAIEMI
jgi:hypothetical protein